MTISVSVLLACDACGSTALAPDDTLCASCRAPAGAPPAPLTSAQLAALRSLRESSATPFSFGSTTVHRLCDLGFAERVHHEIHGRRSTTLHITPAGLARIGAS